jgi:hypothetical protein
MEQKVCQSCGMPLTDPDLFGTNKDQTINEDYCVYCYKDGAFVQGDITMDEMIEHCMQFLEEFNKDSGNNFSKEEATVQMKLYFPTLKRWAKNE